MNIKAFFDNIRQPLFGGSMSRSQVEGCEILLDEMDRRDWSDLRWVAYVLATTLHETASTMQPIEEFGKGKGRPYGVADPETGKTYFGRGFVQITWKDNYRRMGEILGQPLVTKPELALDPSIAAQIICEGMQRGSFTGRKLGDYFSATKNDPREARRIVNALDKADLIAGYHQAFLDALEFAAEAREPDAAPVEAGDGLAALTARVEALEAKIAAMGRALL